MRQRTRILILSLVALAILAAGLSAFHYIPDDTFITLRYARNVLRGKGFVFNPGERVEGYTNFLWLLIVVFAGKLGFPLVAGARALSLALLARHARARRALRRGGTARPARSAPGAGGRRSESSSPPRCSPHPPRSSSGASSGSEMPLFTFLLLAGFMLLRAGNAARSRARRLRAPRARPPRGNALLR